MAIAVPRRVHCIRVRRLLAPTLARVPLLPPIGLTAAALFAGGEVSRADLCVRQPDSFTCAVVLRQIGP